MNCDRCNQSSGAIYQYVYDNGKIYLCDHCLAALSRQSRQSTHANSPSHD